MQSLVLEVKSIEDFSDREFYAKLKGERGTTVLLYLPKDQPHPRLGDKWTLAPLTIPTVSGVIAEQLAAVGRATETAYNEPQPPEGLERVEEWMAAPAADEDGQ